MNAGAPYGSRTRLFRLKSRTKCKVFKGYVDSACNVPVMEDQKLTSQSTWVYETKVSGIAMSAPRQRNKPLFALGIAIRAGQDAKAASRLIDARRYHQRERKKCYLIEIELLAIGEQEDTRIVRSERAFNAHNAIAEALPHCGCECVARRVVGLQPTDRFRRQLRG